MSLDSQSGSRYGPRSDHRTPDGDAERNGLLRAQGTGGRRMAAASSTGRCRYHAHTYFEGPHLTRGGVLVKPIHQWQETTPTTDEHPEEFGKGKSCPNTDADDVDSALLGVPWSRGVRARGPLGGKFRGAQ